MDTNINDNVSHTDTHNNVNDSKESAGHSRSPVIIPIAGGKGGVGKTMLCANLAIALSRLGKETVAVDLDLGGSNLHSYLGLGNIYPGIGDYIKHRGTELEDYLVPVENDNLTFLPGDGVNPFMANIAYNQKKRLLTAIKGLNADFILLDLGAGTSYNVLDYFALSNHGILAATPEFPSVISILGFLKNFLFRRIEHALKKDSAVTRLLTDIYNRPMGDEPVTIPLLMDEISKTHPKAGETISALSADIRPGIAFNMGQSPDDLSVIKRLAGGMNKVLGVQADYIGFVFSDPRVATAIKNREPLLTVYPECLAAREIMQIARRIIKFQQQPVENSAQLLKQSTLDFYRKHHPDENKAPEIDT